MLFEVDFSIKVNESFCTIHTAFIHAQSVSDCRYQAEEIRDSLHQSKRNQIHIFIRA